LLHHNKIAWLANGSALGTSTLHDKQAAWLTDGHFATVTLTCNSLGTSSAEHQTDRA
jgi:hypothetical protein